MRQLGQFAIFKKFNNNTWIQSFLKILFFKLKNTKICRIGYRVDTHENSSAMSTFVPNSQKLLTYIALYSICIPFKPNRQDRYSRMRSDAMFSHQSPVKITVGSHLKAGFH